MLLDYYNNFWTPHPHQHSLLACSLDPTNVPPLASHTQRNITNIQKNDFSVQGKTMPALNDHEHYRYLGIPIGMTRNIDNLYKLVAYLTADLEHIQSSQLAPWQKLDTIRTFIQPCLTFSLRSGEPMKSSLLNYRNVLLPI